MCIRSLRVTRLQSRKSTVSPEPKSGSVSKQVQESQAKWNATEKPNFVHQLLHPSQSQFLYIWKYAQLLCRHRQLVKQNAGRECNRIVYCPSSFAFLIEIHVSLLAGLFRSLRCLFIHGIRINFFFRCVLTNKLTMAIYLGRIFHSCFAR